jgi:hypothetical protein
LSHTQNHIAIARATPLQHNLGTIINIANNTVFKDENR